MAKTCTVELTVKLPEVTSAQLNALDDLIRRTAFLVMVHAVYSMTGPKSGRIYRRGKRGNILHQASAPGEPPAIDTGALANSIKPVWLDNFLVRVAVHSYYGVFLEFGTKRMAARPFLRPAVQAVAPRFQQGIAQAMSKRR